MSTTIKLVLVVAFAFLASRFLQRLTSRRALMLSGAEYLVVGVLIGPLVAGLLDTETLALIGPEVWLIEGLLGFTLGLQLRGAIATGGLRDTASGLVLASAMLAAMASLGGLVLVQLGHPSDPTELALPALIFGACATVFSGHVVQVASRTLGARGPVTDLLEVAAVVADALAILIAGLVMDWERAKVDPATRGLGLPDEVWLVTSLIVGIICGLLYVLFHRNEENDERTFLATVGVVIFASGIAAALGSSPLLVGLVAGVTVSALSPVATQLSERLHLLDRPAGIMLFIFAGAFWSLPTTTGWILAGVYVAGRVVALWLLPRATLQVLMGSSAVGTMGAGMRSQGVLAVALALSMRLAYPELSFVFDALIVGVLAFELGAGGALGRMLADAGELGRVTPTPAADAPAAPPSEAPAVNELPA